MPSVTNLVIQIQSGSDNTHFASWDFKETITTTSSSSSSSINTGDLVTILDGATYYNGVSIPTWVKNMKWYIMQVGGDRAVLGKSENGDYNIVSPINTKYISNGQSSGSTTTTTTTNYLDHFTVKWYYDTGDGVWFSGGSSDTTEKYATYNSPANAISVKVTVLPVSKTYKVNDTDTSYWTGTTVTKTYLIAGDPPEKMSAPTVTIDKYKLTASLENISDPRTDKIKFEVYKGTTLVKTGVVTVLTRRATYSCTVDAGSEYRVRCASININNNSDIYGEWSDFSSSAGTMPSAPFGITVCKASSATSVHLEWDAVNSATSYDIEYATKSEYFDGSNNTTTITGIEFTHYEKTGLESGQEYFFRIRAVNGKGKSAWSGMKSIVIGKLPSTPTTWSSTTTSITGESLILYWVHNAEDRSSQTFAELELYINGIKETYTISNTEVEEEKDKTSSYTIDTTPYTEGSTIQWRVRTAGITKAYGDWSIQRTIDIYAPVTLALTITDQTSTVIETLSGFPFYVSALAGPKTQSPISYHLTIKSNEIYESVDQIGNRRIVNVGEEIYSRYFDTSDALLVEMSAGHVDLENDIAYTIVCTVAMNSGLTAESSVTFNVSWSDDRYEPNAEIGIDLDTYSAYIRPFCINDDETPIGDVLLSVFRREFDGSFIEIASGLENSTNVHVTDPHPALDYARYRIVATSKTTGGVNYYDVPGYPIMGKAVIIQWDEEWSNFDTSNEDPLEHQPWTGSLLRLPYNIDVSDNHKPDSTLVNYIGRSHPVSYYGTQIGSTSTWDMVVEKSDKDTLYALRRLAMWLGDVYVREPSGSGYWANIKVSFSQKHRDLTIPVTLDITRVEGGV